MTRAVEVTADLDALDRFVPGVSCRIPHRRPGVIGREGLVKSLVDADVQCVVMSAPAGYGKTTTAALWAEEDPRPVAWVHVGRADADSIYLLRHVARALAVVNPLPDTVIDIIAGPGRSALVEVLPALLTAIERMDQFVLVFDDAHLLQGPDVEACVEALIDGLPQGATVALVGRTVAGFSVARWRVSDQVHELEASDLAMSEAEARRMFDWVGIDLGDDGVADLVERTEGWPAALHLAELSIDRGGPGALDTEVLSGRDRKVADYLVDEVLRGLPKRTVSFLERSSVLDRMCAPLLDDLLETSDAGHNLQELESSGNLFLVPLDDERRWYRYHQLFAELLRARLELRDPIESNDLHRRASGLFEAAGDPDLAIHHAIAAGDAHRASELILHEAARVVLHGESALLGRWLQELGATAIETDPLAALCQAWFGVGSGDASVVEDAIRTARRTSDALALADRSQLVDAGVGLLTGIIGVGSPAVTIDVTTAVIAADADPTWSTVARVVRGVARAISDDRDEARIDFEAALPQLRHLPAFDSGARAHLALLASLAGDDATAEQRAREALDIAHRERLEGLPMATISFAVGALIAAKGGRPAEARAELATAAALLVKLGNDPARTALICHAVLASAAVALDDGALAAIHLAHADTARAAESGAPQINTLIDDAHETIATRALLEGRPSLTPAELRVLRYLATHLALQDIADALCISRNTAKTHSSSIYLKLGVTSRSEAVTVAEDMGLLDRRTLPSSGR